MRKSNRSPAKGLIHGIAHCRDCKWQNENYLTVQREAAKHARITGHRVMADLGYVVEYGPPKDIPPLPAGE